MLALGKHLVRCILLATSLKNIIFFWLSLQIMRGDVYNMVAYVVEEKYADCCICSEDGSNQSDHRLVK